MPHKNPEDRREYDRKRRELRRLLKADPKAGETRAKELEAEKIARRNNPAAKTPETPTAPVKRRKSRNPDTESRKKVDDNRARGKRICGEEACTTVLSVYNTEDYCAIHAPARNRDTKIFM